ncbi:MAG TPA: flavodoxin-dependent (E)-4-hydroxy-3-methylbut-2-enyl-diphosphate synthase [Candidatus Hydrothermia bacterium]|nr:flavodoxin-dependent (E)-4-hydroxy-3-methylbut-2-enyl-diphosphate synthase [Candidatus Hydrothermae bacterium]MDD3649260.1 flavodoxin-dependent (E)-4-hydroxy-3-methylbut-2-enyl-diphosphate synthase [Candidatus Hydrothermia bacterium]MDD5573213.1 flavodoxin-dependent (E)-4-hydroxy-3-methylbut-2-enyl-diphosphate synthase [Candidatus Hydrothermia bacterium]HOK22674.1 flavodoxin-dependent (E)-4-hydroxy-3-methylbut-2-enyl-diphosphate synthase [Candidatus Hydrothermia bacterium]HOL23383.1 flavodox
MKRNTKVVSVRGLGIGGENPIRIQSMTSTKTTDIDATLKQIEELVKEDCELVRIAIPDFKSLEAFKEIRKRTTVPLIADVHFNYKIAIGAIEVGADKIRINPGNIGDKAKVKEIISALKQNKKPLRIGVNSGSLEEELIEKCGGVTSECLVESATRWVDFFVKEGFDDIIISVKSSSVLDTVKSYTMLSSKLDFPLHLGVTEAGPLIPGTVKSSIAIGNLLMNGIGDTIRVSLTEDPVVEVRVAWEILKALDLRYNAPVIVSCPTCARTRVDLMNLVREIEYGLRGVKKPLKIAIMGCEVNGPGEARDADLGVAAEPGRGVIFKRGKMIKRIPQENIVKELLMEIENFFEEDLR